MARKDTVTWKVIYVDSKRGKGGRGKGEGRNSREENVYL